MRTVCQFWHFGSITLRTCTSYLHEWGEWGRTFVVLVTTHRIV